MISERPSWLKELLKIFEVDDISSAFEELLVTAYSGGAFRSVAYCFLVSHHLKYDVEKEKEYWVHDKLWEAKKAGIFLFTTDEYRATEE